MCLLLIKPFFRPLFQLGKTIYLDILNQILNIRSKYLLSTYKIQLPLSPLKINIQYNKIRKYTHVDSILTPPTQRLNIHEAYLPHCQLTSTSNEKALLKKLKFAYKDMGKEVISIKWSQGILKE